MDIIGILGFKCAGTIGTKVGRLILQVFGLNVVKSFLATFVKGMAEQAFPLRSGLFEATTNVLLTVSVEICNEINSSLNSRFSLFCALLCAFYWYAHYRHFAYWKISSSTDRNRLDLGSSAWPQHASPHWYVEGTMRRISSISTDSQPWPSRAKWSPLVGRGNLQKNSISKFVGRQSIFLPFCVLLYALCWYAHDRHFAIWNLLNSTDKNRRPRLPSVWSRYALLHFDAEDTMCRISSISTDAQPWPSHAKCIPLVECDNLQILCSILQPKMVSQAYHQ